MRVLIFIATFIGNIFHYKNSTTYYHTIHRYSCTVPLAACYHTIHWYSCTVPLVPVRFESNLNFLDRLSKNLRIKNFLKIRTVREELLRSDIQTDGRTERRS